VPSAIRWTEPVVIARVGRGTAIVSAALGDGTRWARLADTAARKIAPRVVRVAPTWSGRLIVEVPGTRQLFEQVLGAEPGSYAQIAAVTTTDRRDRGSTALTIVINPAAAARLDGSGLGVLLAHEGTHVATHSIHSRAPLWAVEGFADYVAYQAYPPAQQAALGPLLADVRRNGAPEKLPGDGEFRASAPDLGLTYARAWLACRYVAETSSPQRLARIYAELDRGRTLEQASKAAGFADSAAEFVAGWRHYLTVLAGS
jgi:hypothetical protein